MVPNNPMLRLAEMSRAYENMERLVGGPRILRENLSRAEKAFALMETVTVPHSLLKQGIKTFRDINSPDNLIVILESENFDLPPYHYKQACSFLADNYYDTCNGQIRNCLEALILEIYERKTGRKVENYYSALDGIKKLGFINHEEVQILNEIKKEWNKRGSHPGRSSKPEAEERLQCVTFLSRFLLYKILNTPEGSPKLRIEK